MSKLSNKPLRVEKLEKVSGFDPSILSRIPILKKKHYRILLDVSVGGDAPKELIRCYQFKRGKPQINNPKIWDLYIAKTGHKWYPYESITEFILNKTGACIGVDTAHAKLVNINGQLRFLSRFFLGKNELLEHGAELYGGYLNDQPFVEHIEEENKARDFFTVSFTYQTFKHLYPNQAEELFGNFLRMLVFDAILGNNDRHFYNWGVVKRTHGEGRPPYFSPIYDTARALCWHTPEKQVVDLSRDDRRRSTFLEKYTNNSKPKVGIENQKIKNHFELISALRKSPFDQAKSIIYDMITSQNKNKCNELLMDEMRLLMSKERFQIVSECLNLRFNKLLKLL